MMFITNLKLINFQFLLGQGKNENGIMVALNPLPDGKISDLCILKEFTDDNSNMFETLISDLE